MRALPAASAGCVVVYVAESWARARRDRDGKRVPAHRILVKKSGIVRSVRRDGVFDVSTPNGFAFVSPLAIVKLTAPKEA